MRHQLMAPLKRRNPAAAKKGINRAKSCCQFEPNPQLLKAWRPFDGS
jgi:hypothetical protein